uniref:Uncharacterized protein n=1 Tax=Panagrellus redivivus TaxID=6233 RepID=A0A7E4UPE4_PANRE
MPLQSSVVGTTSSCGGSRATLETDLSTVIDRKANSSITMKTSEDPENALRGGMTDTDFHSRRVPQPIDQKSIAIYAAIVALCFLTLIMLGIAAFMVFIR